MDLDELLTLLELEDPSEFEYFENFAEIVESDTEIPEDTLYQLFSQVEPGIVGELIENYFEEILEAMPDDCTDIFLLLENIRRSLKGLLLNEEEEQAKVYFAEELARFRRWYTKDSEVSCIDQETQEEKVLALRDALVLARLERLNEEEYAYDFTSCLDYDIEEFIMNIAIAGDEAEEE